MLLPRARGHGRIATDAVADDFERATLGSNWARPQGDVVIVNSQSIGAGSLSGIHVGAWIGSTPALGADQFAEVRVATDISTMEYQVFVRRRDADLARYGLIYDQDDPQNKFWAIKYDGVPTIDTRYFLNPNYTAPLLPGDTIRLEVRGQSPVNLRGYHNGRLVIEANDTDSSRILSGFTGVAYRARTGTTLTYPSPVFSSFAAGQLVAG